MSQKVKHPDVRNKSSSGSSKSKKQKIIFAGLASGLLIASIAGALIAIGKSGKAEPIEDFTPVIEEISEVQEVDSRVPSPLTGKLVRPELAKRRVTAVMIENSTDARPQSGLQEAGMVFEAIAEGGITRFMAVYQEDKPDNIGPIRSARPYYVEWARGLDAAYVHSGGSAQALSLIPSLGVKDLDHGNFGSALADRVSFRYAPHNVYTSMDKIDSVASSSGFKSSDFVGFKRPNNDRIAESNSKENSQSAKTVNFNFSGHTYNTEYKFDSKTKLYNRSMAGAAHKDKDSGKQIAPRVLIGLETSYSIHSNGVHSIYKTVGSGSAKVFQNGELINATWRKNSATASLEILGSDGKALTLEAGQTWVSVIQPGQVSYK